MKVVFSKNEEGSSKLSEISVIDDKGNILEKVDLYAEQSFDEFFPGLYNADEKVLSMLRHIYNSGIKNEDIEFEEKEND